MKKNGILYVALLSFSQNVLMCVNDSLLCPKHAWLHELQYKKVQLVPIQPDMKLKYEHITWDKLSDFIECDVNIISPMASSQHCCVDVRTGSLEEAVDKNVYHMNEHEQEAQRTPSMCASWTANKTLLKVRMATSIDTQGQIFSYGDFRAHRFVYDSDSGLAIALIDIFKPSLSSFREKLWCLYTASVIHSTQQPGPVELMCELIKPMPKLGAKVLKIHIVQNGKRILFFLANGAVKIISSHNDDITLPFLWNIRNKRVADLSFSFK